jgi:acetyl esterase/lipase
MSKSGKVKIIALATLWIWATVTHAQLNEAAKSAVLIENSFRVEPNVTYGLAGNYELKLDVYYPKNAASPVPVVMFIHGGGWQHGSKEGVVLQLLPYLEMGWGAVNVEYRQAGVALAPAAVEDCRCALRWIARNAAKYKFDASKIIVTGGSAGGHLALMTGMLPASSPFDNQCAFQDDDWSVPWHDKTPVVAAIVNWFGITDVAAMLHGDETRSYALSWLGSRPNREDLARQMSPVAYVRAELPPIISIHGDADTVVPYAQAVRLHQALSKAGVRNRLLTIHDGGHSRFSDEQMENAFETIGEFLAKAGLNPISQH